MKRTAALVSTLACIAVIGMLGLQTREIVAEKREASGAREKFPDIELLDLDDAVVRIMPDPFRSTVLVFFTTTCEFCAAGIDQIRAHADAFATTSVVLISPEDRERIRAYRRDRGLDRFPQLQVLRDNGPELGARLHIRRVPTVLVYGPDGRLHGAFEGLTPIREILEAAGAIR